MTATDQDRIGNIMYRVGTNSYPFELNSVTGVVSLQYDNLFYGPTQYQVRDLNPACQELLLKYFTVEERYQAVKVNWSTVSIYQCGQNLVLALILLDLN